MKGEFGGTGEDDVARARARVCVCVCCGEGVQRERVGSYKGSGAAKKEGRITKASELLTRANRSTSFVDRFSGTRTKLPFFLSR